ncbi:MAG: HAMP domain-containing sensor histidine kinase [Candidatus Paceibacterota bacterium]
MNSFSFFYGMGTENILLLSAGTINLAFAVLLFFTDQRNKKNILFSLIAVSISMWAFSMAGFYLSSNATLVNILSVCLYVSAACFPFFFYFFVSSLGGSEQPLPLRNKMTAVAAFILSVIIVNIPDFVITVPDNSSVKTFLFGPGYILYELYQVTYLSVCFHLLFEKYKKATEPLLKKQLLFLFLGLFSGSFICVLTNLVFPAIGWWDWFWFGPVATIIMVVFVGYSTVKHNLFNTKSVVVVAVTFVLWVAMAMRLFLSVRMEDYVINGSLFVLVVGSGLILIRAIYQEIDQLEKIESIAKDLEIANEHLRVLDKQKSEFVSIASHQLRTPLTAITGYTSMVIEGSYGPVSEKVTDVLSKVLESSRRLAVIIDDFLTISHIEQGKMTYKFETVEMKQMTQNIVEEFAERAKLKNLSLTFTSDGYDTYNVTADSGKIRQILSNLIDNSIKYTPAGSVEVHLSKDFGLRKTRIMIKDTGIGLSRESIAALFQKFSRAKEVQKVYTDGSGIGLYIGQELIKAHHGRIWVESEGEGKGSSFFIELLSED